MDVLDVVRQVLGEMIAVEKGSSKAWRKLMKHPKRFKRFCILEPREMYGESEAVLCALTRALLEIESRVMNMNAFKEGDHDFGRKLYDALKEDPRDQYKGMPTPVLRKAPLVIKRRVAENKEQKPRSIDQLSELARPSFVQASAELARKLKNKRGN